MSQEIAALRTIVAEMPRAAEVMAPYLDKVRECAYSVTDADVEALKAAGCSEDEIFEQTVAVAVTEGFRRLDAGLEALR
jgi:alkylhydroperoxidase family enzyme